MLTNSSVAITGMGVVSALGIGLEAFDSALRTGNSGICQKVSDDDVDVWAPLPDCNVVSQCEKLGVDEATIKRLTRVSHRSSKGLKCSLVAATEAWKQAGLEYLDGEQVGLIIAGNNLTNNETVDTYQRLLQGKHVRPSYAVQFLDTNYVGVISEALSLYGEGYSIGGASASGGVAIAQGRRAILSGDVSAVLIVGVPMLLSRAELSAFYSAGALYQGGVTDDPSLASCPFDQGAAGFVYGQAAAALVLEPYERAGERALAILKSATMALDANHSTNPRIETEKKVMQAAMKQASLKPCDIDLVSTHGTSSALGDKVEASALSGVFDQVGARPWINATKSLTGHCLSSAGIIEAVAAVLQLRGCYMHPNPTLYRPINSSLSWVGNRAQQCQFQAVMSNSFGFGGINSSQIFTLT